MTKKRSAPLGRAEIPPVHSDATEGEIATWRPSDVVTGGDSSIVPSGIVPPYLEGDWRRLRQKLHAVGVAAEAAALSSTTEEMRRYIGEASVGLIDADFMLRQIERKNDVDDH